MTAHKKSITLTTVIALIILLLVADQALKFYIKTNFFMDEEYKLFGNWGKLHFVENAGMAWGIELGGNTGKLLLTLFRVVAVSFGVYYIIKIVREGMHRGLIICIALIFAGAVGNLIDSLFYGLIFTESPRGETTLAQLVPWGKGYGTFLHGKVVDMFYFPVFHATWPTWIPVIGGDNFEFFSPVFNLADACISVGVIILLLFQTTFLPKKNKEYNPTVTTNSTISDSAQVQ